MTRPFVSAAIAILLCCAGSPAHGAPRGKGGDKRPGGSAAEARPEGKKMNEQSRERSGQLHDGGAAKLGGKQSLGGVRPDEALKGRQGQEHRGNAHVEPGVHGAAGAAAAKHKKLPATGAPGAAAGAAAANLRNPGVAGAAGAAAVRNSFNHPGLYGRHWYGNHHGAWLPAGWAAGAGWTPATWAAVAGLCGYANSAPASFGYGNNVTYEGGDVYINGENVATAEEFRRQAVDLAAGGAAVDPSETEQWLSLGVFAMVRNERQRPQVFLQLAVNELGNVRGNYTDEMTDRTLPIRGAVDPETQRAAWTVGDDQSSVMEAGLKNLTEDEAPALLHKDGKTEHWLLVRLEQPEQDEVADPAGATE